VASLFSKRISRATLLALVCISAVLVVSVAGPLHKHDSGQDASCLLCHVGQRANVVAVLSDAVKPFITYSDGPALPLRPAAIFGVPDLTRTPRAPPSSLLSL
jgi:hypothetical protein